MNVQPAQVERCAKWIFSLDANARAYLVKLLMDSGYDETGVVAVLPPKPPDREGGAEAELLWDTE